MGAEHDHLAEEQAALRRVADVVARGAPPSEVFAAVATEASRLVAEQAMTLVRFEGEDELVVVASHGGPAGPGERIRFERATLPDRVRREARVERVDDYTDEPDSSLAARYGLASAVAAPISVHAKVWGMLTTTSSGRPLPVGTEERLQPFAELVAAAVANSQARDDLRALADEQTALRRIAQLTAQEAPTKSVLHAVAVQASRLASVEFGMVLCFEPDGSTEIVAVDGAPSNFQVGMRAPAAGDGSVHRVWRTRRAARVDDLAAMSGQWPRMAAEYRFTTSAGVPVFLQEGRLWGAIIVVGRDHPMPPGLETHLADFAELVGTAITAAQARAELRVLAAEHAAVGSIAELVARGADLEAVFAAAAAEASRLLGDLAAVLLRYEDGDVAVAVATCNSPAPVGLRVPSGPETATGEVLRSGRAVRVEDFQGTPLAELARELDVRAGVAVPITVEGSVWGALTTSTAGPPLPADTEQRLAQFADLVAVAIANAQNKDKLTASRARVIAAADDARRQLQRDLHDGAQQRLVHTLISLKLAKEAAPDRRSTAALIDEALAHAGRANQDLRDLARGILPASLTRGGLHAGLESLAADLSLPLDVRVAVPRLGAHLETTAYFIAAEALTNVVKHANATHAGVEVTWDGDQLSILVSDDGIGGADPTLGSGLTGLSDRVEAAEGTLTITSPRGRGTTVHAVLKAPREPPAAT